MESPRPRVLLVADPDRIGELVSALADPIALHGGGEVAVEHLASHGGDDTIELFEAHRPTVVVVTASLVAGDAKSLIDALRELAPRAHVAIVVIGDDTGPIRTALDAMELAADRFVTRPLAAKALRYAVGGLVEQVMLARGITAAAGGNGVPAEVAADGDATRSAMRARWEAIADSMVEWNGEGSENEVASDEQLEEVEDAAIVSAMPSHPGFAAQPEDDIVELDLAPDPDPLPPPIIIKPRRRTEPMDQPNGYYDVRASHSDQIPIAPQREPTLILSDPEPAPDAPLTRPATVPGPLARATGTAPLARVPLLQRPIPVPTILPRARTNTGLPAPPPPAPIAPREPEPPDDANSVIVAERGADESWSEPVILPELVERDSNRELSSRILTTDELAGIDEFDDDHVIAEEQPGTGVHGRLEVLGDLEPVAPRSRPISQPIRTYGANLADEAPLLPGGEDAGAVASVVAADGRDFARQLRAKMSMMAQRLFAGDAAAAPPVPVDHGPRHDHHTEIDLAALGEEPELGGSGGTEIEGQRSGRIAAADSRDLATSPGSWDTQVRERGVPDSGELVRGQSDAAMLLARTFAAQMTCHVVFRRDDVEKTVHFDQGRPVFAASNEALDRMGELLVREGKITASQYERCQAVVAESGRRMGEILVDFGYLKRRELLPAVRRHVEDIVYSLFGWDHGQYQIVLDPVPSAERIRLSRHPAALVLEGIRRKLDRSTLERMVGPPSTVIEVPDRERLGGIINLSDLSGEERAALAAIDGQADLAAVARIAGVDVADLLPLAWGLCVLGLATARRTDTEVPEESTALVGETDLAIDRERVRARWQLVTDADYFALLGVRRDATTFEIRRAYQSARRDFAADCFPTDLRRELARELDDIANVLDEAFRVLRDDRLRLTYLSNLFA